MGGRHRRRGQRSLRLGHRQHDARRQPLDRRRRRGLPQRTAPPAARDQCRQDHGRQDRRILNELANAIIEFWKNVLGAVLTLLAGLVAALAVAAGGITAVIAVAIAAAALVVFNDAVVSQINMFTDVGNAIAIQTRELINVGADDTAFPGGAWPPAAATDMNDGSITDGDDTDWHIE